MLYSVHYTLNTNRMDSPHSMSDGIRELQDTVVTLRLNIPTFYKKLLVKECELEHKSMVETEICVPKQPIHKLEKIERITKQNKTIPNVDVATDVQEVQNILNILQKMFPKQQ